MNVSMESPCAGRTIIDIRQTSLKHKHITKYMPAVYALTGCDTVSYLSGIGKVTTLNVLVDGHHLIERGRHGAGEHKLVCEVSTFVAACYERNVGVWQHVVLSVLQLQCWIKHLL